MKKVALLSLIASCLLANPINAISREDGSGTRSAFVELFDITKEIKGKKLDNISPKIAITNSTGVMITSVKNDKFALGYISLGALNNDLKALKIDNIEPNIENIKNNSYKISRDFNLAIIKSSDLIDDFFEYLKSNQASKIISDLKYISLESKDYISKQIKGELIIQGSSSVSPLMQKLANAYMQINKSAKIKVLTSDSSMGISSLVNNIADIAMVSRDLKQSELDKGIKSFAIAKDAIVIIVNKENPLNNLSNKAVKEIYLGNIVNYKDLSE